MSPGKPNCDHQPFAGSTLSNRTPYSRYWRIHSWLPMFVKLIDGSYLWTSALMTDLRPLYTRRVSPVYHADPRSDQTLAVNGDIRRKISINPDQYHQISRLYMEWPYLTKQNITARPLYLISSDPQSITISLIRKQPSRNWGGMGGGWGAYWWIFRMLSGYRLSTMRIHQRKHVRIEDVTYKNANYSCAKNDSTRRHCCRVSTICLKTAARERLENTSRYWISR